MTRKLVLALCIAAVAACKTAPKETSPAPPVPGEAPAPPTVTRGEFLIEADKNDTWNAVGQLAVRTPGVTYEGRSQMMDIYSLKYRGQEFMVQTKAMLLSDTIKKTTTRVTATTQDGRPIDSDAVAELLGMLQRDLPAEIKSVQAQFAAKAKAEKEAKAKAKKQKAKKKKKA